MLENIKVKYGKLVKLNDKNFITNNINSIAKALEKDIESKPQYKIAAELSTLSDLTNEQLSTKFLENKDYLDTVISIFKENFSSKELGNLNQYLPLLTITQNVSIKKSLNNIISTQDGGGVLDFGKGIGKSVGEAADKVSKKIKNTELKGQINNKDEPDIGEIPSALKRFIDLDESDDIKNKK
jgi:hypothetical protein